VSIIITWLYRIISNQTGCHLDRHFEFLYLSFYKQRIYRQIQTDISSNERDNELFSLGAVSSRLGYHKLVQSFDSALKAGKLHHRVGDLTTPQRNKALVESEGSVNNITSNLLGLLKVGLKASTASYWPTHTIVWRLRHLKAKTYAHNMAYSVLPVAYLLLNKCWAYYMNIKYLVGCTLVWKLEVM